MNKNLKLNEEPRRDFWGKNIQSKETRKCKDPEAGVGPGAIRKIREAQGEGRSACGQKGSRSQAMKKLSP